MAQLIEATIKYRRDTAANWASNNPTPAEGEPCFETDTGIFKIGNGTTAYNSLAIINIGTPVGAVTAYTVATAPTGYLLCDGSAVSRATYSDLFAVISTDYGIGDGSTTFNVPDYRGVFLRGAGNHGSMTKADGTAFGGGTVGDENNDKMQGHYHSSSSALYGPNFAIGGVGSGNLGNAVTVSITSPKADGTNGTPRTGDETNPANIAVTWIIKI